MTTRLGAGQQGFNSSQVQEIFLCFKTSRPIQGPQPPTEWVMGDYSPGIKQHRTQPAVSEHSGTATYELTYWPEQAHLIQVSRVAADLEHRLHKLQTVVGATADRVVQ